VAEQSDNLVGTYKVVASDTRESRAATMGAGAEGQRSMGAKENARGGFDGELRQEQPEAPEKLTGEIKKGQATRTAVNPLG
jgi:hypothetical protein